VVSFHWGYLFTVAQSGKSILNVGRVVVDVQGLMSNSDLFAFLEFTWILEASCSRYEDPAVPFDPGHAGFGACRPYLRFGHGFVLEGSEVDVSDGGQLVLQEVAWVQFLIVCLDLLETDPTDLLSVLVAAKYLLEFYSLVQLFVSARLLLGEG
jgi:hypothetical protein